MRALRLAAASLAEPLGAAGVTVALAEALPATLQPALDLVGFSPFGALAGAAPAGGGGPGAASSGKRRPAPQSSAAQAASPAGAASGRAQAGRAATAAGSQARAAGEAGKPPTGGATAQFDQAAETLAQRILANMARDAQANAPAPAPPLGGALPQAADILGTLVGAVERLPVVGSAVPAARAALTPSAAATQSARAPGAGEQAPPAGGDLVSTTRDVVFEGLATAAGLIPGRPGQAASGLVAEAWAASIFAPIAADLVAAGVPLPAEVLARAQRAPAPATSPAAAAAVAPAQTPSAPTAAPTTSAPAVNGAAAAAAAPPPDPADLAWLVNEALVEQARRHGMDLS